MHFEIMKPNLMRCVKFRADLFVCDDYEQTTINISKKCDGTNDCPVSRYRPSDYVADDETSFACAGPGKSSFPVIHNLLAIITLKEI